MLKIQIIDFSTLEDVDALRILRKKMSGIKRISF